MSITASTILPTLSQYLMQSQPPNSKGDFTLMMMSLQTAIKIIEKRIRRAGISGYFGSASTSNSTGDDQKTLDVVSHKVFVSQLEASERVSVMVSEEEDAAIVVSSDHSITRGAYYLAFDPLDGSSNIDANITVGSIWGVWKLDDSTVANMGKTSVDKSVLFRPGNQLVSAGYAMYGSATVMTLAFHNSVDIFTLDNSVGEFVLTQRNVRIPMLRRIYSVNEGNTRFFHPWFNNYLEHVKHQTKKPYSARYIGSLVGDLHRTILYGGIYCYPDDKRSPNGKLRLLYEVAPSAFIVEAAGGKATTGSMRVLDVVPTSIHQRVPVFIGSPAEVDLCMSFRTPTQSKV